MKLQRGEADIKRITEFTELENAAYDINNDEEENNISETDEETEASESVNSHCQRDKAVIEKKFHSVFQEVSIQEILKGGKEMLYLAYCF